MQRLLFIFCVCFLTAAAAGAQIVNIESKRMQTDSVGWKGSLNASMSLTQNTTKIFGASVGAHLQYKTSNDQGLWLILGQYGFLKSGGQKFISNSLGHIRYNRKVNNVIRWEVFGQLQYNLITKIKLRSLLGTGPRFRIVKKEKFRLYAACLFMYENEKELTTPVVRHNDLRNSSYVSFTIIPKDNIQIISTTFYQPLLKKFNDYRMLNQVVFAVEATKGFTMTLNWEYLYDSSPAGVAPRTTYSFSAGVAHKL
jgi:hypothetical protein